LADDPLRQATNRFASIVAAAWSRSLRKSFRCGAMETTGSVGILVEKAKGVII